MSEVNPDSATSRRHIKGWRLSTRATIFLVLGVTTGLFVLVHLWFHITNPYAGWNIVQQPYTTKVENGKITFQKQFSLHAYSGQLAQLTGYYKSGFLIVQNTFFGGHPLKSSTVDGIASDLYQLRFDPSKPYLISGDQFSVLYPRNLGVFYSSALDPSTVTSQKDWENRQRIYLQSVLYALDAFASKQTLTTTLVPIGPHSVALTEVHPGSVPSDTLYGLLFSLNAMEDQSPYPHPQYSLETTDAVQQILQDRRDDLQKLLQVYLNQVRDPSTGLIKRGIVVSGARDGVRRDSSFYDNIILWKTLQLADKLGIQHTPISDLVNLRDRIIKLYWDDKEGHFKDDLSSRPANQNYSSDWLFAMPTGFLSSEAQPDLTYITRSVDFIHAQHIADPFPIKYQVASAAQSVPWAVKVFVPNYGSNAIWSYWGCVYIDTLSSLYGVTHQTQYDQEAKYDLNVYAQKIVENHGFPETFSPDGALLKGGIYKSILLDGWIVAYKAAEVHEAQQH